MNSTRVLCRGRTCECRQLLGRQQWYIMSRGEEQALRCPVVCVGEGRSEGLSAGLPGQVLKELRDARLLLVRIPPSSFPDVLHYGRHWGLSRWRPFSLLHVTARPATKAPVTALYFRGRRCTAAPNAQNRPTLHVSQPLLYCVRSLRASLSDQPQSSHVLFGASGASYPSGAYAFHRNPRQLTCAQHVLAGKRPP